MACKVIGLIQVKNQEAFDNYRTQVPGTIKAYGGEVLGRGVVGTLLWNELNCEGFQLTVEIIFPDVRAAQGWAESREYQELLAVRSEAIRLTLFVVDIGTQPS
jgi:uncharacterized protein (DUF1330 family)